ncbi:MAG TPA: hypothetical protein VJ809_11115, partial [Pirellulales bacterium]|nr:hypothetical protein [Pirellulales bacterium]
LEIRFNLVAMAIHFVDGRTTSTFDTPTWRPSGVSRGGWLIDDEADAAPLLVLRRRRHELADGVKDHPELCVVFLLQRNLPVR